MEASTLQRKKNTINKGKIKKNFKNVLCRPDAVFWPEVSGDHAERLVIALKKHRINIPQFKKPHWKEVASLPKEKRPKPPKLEKVNGFLFGISECSTLIKDDQCSAVIIEATVNPRMIIQPVLEMCRTKDIPVICLPNLRKLSSNYFGVKTSCLGLQKSCLLDLQSEILESTKMLPKPKQPNGQAIKTEFKENEIDESDANRMDIDVNNSSKNEMDISESPYLYRTNKKTRVFVPVAQTKINKTSKNFIGQDFIEFANEQKPTSKSYMEMIVKKVTNNQHRVKKK